MADKKSPINVFHRLSLDKADFLHLKPLSLYSRTIICDEAPSTCPGLSWTPNSPFRNLKVRLVNSSPSGSRKRQTNDSCLDETYEMPLKKPCLAESSPVFSTPSCSKVASNITCSNINVNKSDPDILPAHTLGSDTRVIIDSQLVSLPTEGRGDVAGPGPMFDFDVDGILCLSPIDSDDASTESLEDFILSCQSFYEEQQSHQSCSDPGLARGQSKVRIRDEVEVESCITTADEGYFTKCYKTDSPITSNHVTHSASNSSEGYVTQSYVTSSPKGSKDGTPSQSRTRSPVMSGLLAEFAQLGKQPLLLTPSVPLKEEKLSPIVHFDLPLSSSTVKELPVVPLLCSTTNKEDEAFSPFTSVHKSVERHQVKEDKPVLSASLQEVNPSEETFWERSEASDSFESALPPKVQVRSKVVLTSKQQEEEAEPSVTVEKDAQCQPPERKEPPESQRNVQEEVQRPVVFAREEDWEREKKFYMNSVTRHMKDNAGAGGVMDELLHLMNAVANQGTQSNGKRWQHPSDLTRRNYQLHNTGGLLSLDDWYDLSCPKLRRFAQVPQVFKRSPVL